MTKKMILKELESILLNLERACRKAEKISKKICIPSHNELEFIKAQVAELIRIGKGESHDKSTEV